MEPLKYWGIERRSGDRATIRELWRTVRDAPGYEVCTDGRVRNKKTGRILKPSVNNGSGKPQVTMMDAGFRITRQVHTLVRDAFPL